MTKLAPKKVKVIRCRGGTRKFRALRLDHGSFAWPTHRIARATRILDTMYNATNNELVRTKTLTKNSIIRIDAGPYIQWYQQHFGVDLRQSGKKGKDKKDKDDKKDETAEDAPSKEEPKKSRHVLAKLKWRREAAGELEPKPQKMHQAKKSQRNRDMC